MIFSNEEWAGYPKDDFKILIKRWCERKNYVQWVDIGEKIISKLPYKRLDAKTIEVDDEFMELVKTHMVKSVFPVSTVR